MDRKKAAQMRLKICQLLDRCGDCPNRYSYRTHQRPEQKCGGCGLYEEIKAAGKRLSELETKPKSGKKTKLSLSRGQYFDFHNQGLSDSDIAEKLGIHQTTLSSWKHRNDIRMRQRPAPDKEIINAYLAGWSTETIRKLMHCGTTHIYNVLEKHGIEKRAKKNDRS